MITLGSKNNNRKKSNRNKVTSPSESGGDDSSDDARESDKSNTQACSQLEYIKYSSDLFCPKTKIEWEKMMKRKKVFSPSETSVDDFIDAKKKS